MIKSKKMSIIVALAVAISLIISAAFVIVGNTQKVEDVIETKVEYESEIFGTDLISLEIIADEDDWKGMLENAIDEQYIMVDVVVNGTKFQNVGIRPKGNSSLSQVVNSDSDRYSFRLQFDEYIKGQTCFGLESFVVNNMITDNTYMKEFVSYELMDEIGVDVPLFGYTDIKLNGENLGLYLAVEQYNESYENRVFSDSSGMLYNVKNTGIGGKKGVNRPEAQLDDPPPRLNNTNKDIMQPKNTANDGLKMNPGENKLQNSSGGSLEYKDDYIESYSSIFDNVVNKGTDSDFQRVIEALEALSEGKDLETYFDVDQILRYLAAHTIVVNLDSYSSNMAQNYYIYENDGQITILPWDYNMAWGGFQSSSAESVVNFPIDTPLSGVDISSRPLIEKLFENTEYLEQYHIYLQELLDNYFSNGKFEKKINSIDTLISNYVENDSTAFCNYEEYKTAISAFINLGNLRAKSVQGQLNGTVPSTTALQTENIGSLIDASDLNFTSLTTSNRGENRDRPKLDQADTTDKNPNLNMIPEKVIDNNNYVLFASLSAVLVFGLLFSWKYQKKY